MSDDAVHFDGDYSQPVQSGPWIPHVDNETQSTLYTAEFFQIASNFKRMEFGTIGVNKASLVEESEGTYPGGPLVKWSRTFASVPLSRVVPEGFVYNYQFEVGTDPVSILEFPLYVTSDVTYDYFLTNDPDSIKLFRSYRLQIIGGVLYGIGDIPTGDTLIAENSILTRWKGNIWQRVTRRVPLFTTVAA